MAEATELSTFAHVGARGVSLCPSRSEQAWYGIALNAEIGNPPAVDYIVARDQEADFFACWDYQRLCNFTKIVLTFGRATVDLVLRGAQLTHVLNAFANVLILPLPLVSGNLDVDIRILSVIHFQQS